MKDSVPTPTTPQSSVKASPPTSSSPGDSPPPQPCLALPTNPPIVLPYTVFRGASVLAAPALPLPDTVYYLLPDGSYQSLSIFLTVSAFLNSFRNTKHLRELYNPSSSSSINQALLFRSWKLSLSKIFCFSKTAKSIVRKVARENCEIISEIIIFETISPMI